MRHQTFSDRERMRLQLIVVGLAILSLSSACGRAKFQVSGALPGQTQLDSSLGGRDPSTYICGTNGVEPIGPTEGLIGSIYSLNSSQPRYTTSDEYIRYGDKVGADFFLGSVNLPTQTFTSGFTLGGKTLANSDGTPLIEYFAFELRSQLKLGPQDEAGDYQLALLSDDGSTLYQLDSNGNRTALVLNEGQHSTDLACAGSTVSMAADSRLPIDLTYYQGPREHIALVMLWRRVADGQYLQDPNCGTSNIVYFDHRNGSRPTSAYQDLLSRGWKPLSSENFQLMSGRNPCATGN